MHWYVQPFSELSLEDLYRILALREQVFTLEQKCDEPDFDFKDLKAYHIFGKKGFEVVAYARLFPPDKEEYVKFGRVVVAPEGRGQKVGHRLLEETLKAILNLFPGKPIKISSQSYIAPLYEKYGFKVTSTEYLEAGIPHLEMIRKP